MKRLVNATSILALALYGVPIAALAQDFPTVTVDGTAVICLPNKKAECPEGAFCVVAKKPENCEANAIEALAAAALGEPVTDPAMDEAAAAEQAAAEQAAAEQAAAEQAAAEQAAAEQAAAEQAAAEQVAAEAAAAEQAAVAAEAAAAEAAAAEAAAAEAAAAVEAAPAVEPEAEVAPAVEPVEVEAAPVEEVAEALDALRTVTVGGQVFVCLPDKDAACPEGAQCVVGKSEKRCEARAEAALAEASGEAPEEPVVTEVPAEDAAALEAAQAEAEAAAAAAAADPTVEIVEAPVAGDEAVETLETALETPVDPVEPVEAPEVEAVAVTVEEGTLPSDVAPAEEATVTTEVVTEDEARASTEEFAEAPVTVAPGKKTGLSDFEKVGLVALGALVIGAMINGNRQVVSNSGDRVVVRQPDGSYQVYKDDNALLREPGSTVRTETFADGSTRTIVQRADGSQVVTIRDATGRVLQRVAYDKTGRGVVLIDDLVAEERVDVTKLPRVQPSRNQISLEDENAALRAQLAAADVAELGRSFSLRQVRGIQEVRWLAPTVDVNNITFETGSSAIQASEAKKLSKLGRLMVQMIEENPGEVFLIEGHTDATGSAASNLALSDRRAESVAKALTEFFDVPPENLVVQGYGEGELKIDTQADERRNRRAAVRIITELLGRNGI